MSIELFSLIVSIVFLVLILSFIRRKKKSQLVTVWTIAIYLMILWCFGLAMQILLSDKLNIDPIYFDYIVYISACFLPIVVFLIGKIYANTNIKIKKRYFFILIIPIITLIVLWTNNYHHLFYKEYSIFLDDTVVGPYSYVHFVYEYTLIFLGIFNLLRSTIKNSGFFSKQSILIIIGVLIPVVANILGTFKIIPMTIYITPICFTFTLFLLVISVFKFNFFDTAPIAIQKVVDSISDSYLVLNRSNKIIDFNKPFIETFNMQGSSPRGKDILELFKKSGNSDKIEKINKAINEVKTSLKTSVIVENFENLDRIFSIEFSSIISNDEYVGTIVLFKDITEHTNDLKKLEENQYIMQRQAQFSILGEFAGRTCT